MNHPKDEENTLVQKGLPCGPCGSSDGVALYSDGHTYCFVCRDITRDGTQTRKASPRMANSETSAAIQEVISAASLAALPARKLTQETCRKWGYLVRRTTKGLQQMAVYRDKNSQPVGIKFRTEDKDFTWLGKSEGQLFGRHLWGAGGKKIVITEGEIDAMTVSQAQDHQWPVVSVGNGAAEAAKSVAANLEWLSSFDLVVLGFDMDQQGRDAATACAALFPAGKAAIVKWTEKDANAMLLKGKQSDITRCIWQAEVVRPDGIIDARTITDACMEDPTMGSPWPWRAMTNWTLGRRGGELYTFGSGTGMGKTDLLAEIVASTITGQTRDLQAPFAPEGFAIFGYEAGPKTTKLTIAGKLAQRRFQFPLDHPDCMWTTEEKREVLDRMDNQIWKDGGRLFILDSKGAADWDLVKDHCRYLKHSEGVCHFMVDPIGALVVDEEQERTFLDKATLEAAQLSVELDSKVYFVSHLTRPGDGPSHEEGGHVRLKQFRGSNGIGMYSNFVFGLERNQQADTATERCVSTIRAVKDRLTGNCTGETFQLFYDRISGTSDPANTGESPEEV